MQFSMFAEETQLERLSKLGDSCEKGYRNNPLTEEQKQNNREKSKIRCRIEHVFGFMTVSMHGLTIRSIGLDRAKFQIGLTNLVYNICRYSIISQKNKGGVYGITMPICEK